MSTAAAEQWGRRRLVRTLLGVALAGLLLLGGLGYAVYSAIVSTKATPSTPDRMRAVEQLPPGQGRRDTIAAAPMLAVPPEAGSSGVPAASPGPTITIPTPARVGPSDVPTGFPHTPVGAVGQLAAVDVAVLQSMSIARAHQVHGDWAHPEAPPAPEWVLTANIQAFLASKAGQSSRASVVVTPVAAQVKGIDGSDWVLACVLFDVKAQAATTARIAYGHCERMLWSGDRDTGRWIIAPGPAPARAPSTWPGTDLARQAGWSDWITTQQ